MKKIPFEWYDLEGDMMAIPALATTGLMVIPGCEQRPDLSYPKGVVFDGVEYRNYAIDPMGAIILGKDGTYDQKLSEDFLLPETESPCIIPFLEFQQIHS